MYHCEVCLACILQTVQAGMQVDMEWKGISVIKDFTLSISVLKFISFS